MSVSSYNDFYPRSPCGERPSCKVIVNCTIVISIHALLAESDCPICACTAQHPDFYPRSPCGERPCPTLTLQSLAAFLSTLSLRRATVDHCNIADAVKFLSTLSLRRATAYPDMIICTNVISIHALLAESDAGVSTHCETVPDFYPRSPCGERRPGPARLASRFNFYPRSPCGERPGALILYVPTGIFLSTLSLRRATRYLINAK